MSHSTSLRFGDVICLGLQFPGVSATEEGMFYVLGHRSPLSLVEGCQDVIDHVLVAEMPKTFTSSHATFPVPVHSREYWFEIVGKSEYMMGNMLHKFRMQLERLEAEEKQLEGLSNLATPHHSTEQLHSSASGSDLVPARRHLTPVSHHPNDIELCEINIAVLENHATTGPGAKASSAPTSTHFLKEISRLKTRIADLIDLATGEAQRNLENEMSRKGSVVRYGDVIQLRHVLSKTFVALASSSLSSYELSSGDMNCWFAFEPGFKLSAVGDAINMDAEGRLSVKLVSANVHTEGKVFMALSSADDTVEENSDDEESASLSTNLALDGLLEPSRCLPIRTVSSDSAHNRISIFRAGGNELLERTLNGSGVLSGSTIVRFYYRESDSFLAGRRSEDPDNTSLNEPFLIRAADCTSAKIHDFAQTLWFLVDGDGNLAGCGDKLGFGSMVVLQHVVSGLILIAERNPKYSKQTRSRKSISHRRSVVAEVEKSPVESPEITQGVKKGWGAARSILLATAAVKSITKTDAEAAIVDSNATAPEPFYNLELKSLKSVVKAQRMDAQATRQLVARWQISPPSNNLPGQDAPEITDKSLFLLTSCSCDEMALADSQSEIASSIVIGAEQAAFDKKQLPKIGAVFNCSDEQRPEHLFNVEFISPRMLEFVERPRSAVYLLYTFLVELKSCVSRADNVKGSPSHNMLCTFLDKYGQRLTAAFETFARLCCSNSKNEISDTPLDRLIFEAPNREMQLLFGQLGAVSLMSSLIQTLQVVWKGDASVGIVPSYPDDVSQILEDAIGNALIAFVCLCTRSPENKKSVSPDMLDLLSEQLLPIQTLSDTVVRVMVALSAENQPLILKINKQGTSALLKIFSLLKEQRRTTFVDFLSSFLKVNDVPVSEYQRILLHAVFVPDAATIASDNAQGSFFPRVQFFPWKFQNEERLSCHIMMDHISDWGVWPLKDGHTNLIDVLWSMKQKPLPSKISLGKFESNNDIMTFQFEAALDPSTKSKFDIENMNVKDLKSLVNSLCVKRIQYLCSLYCLVASLCHGRNASSRNFFLKSYNYSERFASVDITQSADLHASKCIIPDFNVLVLGVVEDKMPAAFKSACVQLLHSLYVSYDPWTEQDILPHVIVDKCFPRTDSREQSTTMPAHHSVPCIPFEKLTAHIKSTSNLTLENDNCVITFHSVPSTVDFPFNFAEINGHHYFEFQVCDDRSVILDFNFGFVCHVADVSEPLRSSHKLTWHSSGYISGVSKCKLSMREEPIDVAAPSIGHGNIVGCGISASNQYFFTLNQRVIFLYKDESMPTFTADCVSPTVSADAVPFSIVLKEIDVAPHVNSTNFTNSSDQRIQHSNISTTISKVLLPRGEQFLNERDRIKHLLQKVQVALSEDDILASLFGHGCEDAKLMIQSLCKLIESALRTQIDDTDSGYTDAIDLMRSCVKIFEYLSFTFHQEKYPTPEGDDKDRENAVREGSDDEESSSSSSSSSSLSSTTSEDGPMNDAQWLAIFEKGSSTMVLLYACSLLNTLFDIFTKRRIEVFSNFIQDNGEIAMSMSADEILSIIASDPIIFRAQDCLRDLGKFLHVACKCPHDIVKSVVLKLLFQHQSYQTSFIRLLIPVIYVDTSPPIHSVAAYKSPNAFANIARTLERVAKQIRLSESAVRRFLQDPSFEANVLEPIMQLVCAVEDLMSIILPKAAYIDSVHAYLINDMASPCEMLFNPSSSLKWTWLQSSTLEPTSCSASILADHFLNSENPRLSLDSVLFERAGASEDDILHRVGSMFIASEVDQAIIAMLSIQLISKDDKLDISASRSFLVASSIVESIFLRMMEALCAAAKLSQDCQNDLLVHAFKLRALVTSPSVVKTVSTASRSHHGGLRSGAAKVLISLLGENSSFVQSLHSKEVLELAHASFLHPDHNVIEVVLSTLHQHDQKIQKTNLFSHNQSLVFDILTKAIGADSESFMLLQTIKNPSGPLQRCFDRNSVQSEAISTTRRCPTSLLHLDVVRSISACLRGNNFTKASIAQIIPLSNAFSALGLLLSKSPPLNPSSPLSLMSTANRSVAGARSTLAVEFTSSCIVYYCELIAHAHLLSVQPSTARERTDNIPFATQSGMLPILGDYVSAAIEVIKPVATDTTFLWNVDHVIDANAFVDALPSVLSSSSHFSRARAFMSLVAGKISDHCLSSHSNAAVIPSKLEDFMQFMKADASSELYRKFGHFLSGITILKNWNETRKVERNAVFFALSSATLLYLMNKFKSDLASFTIGQLNLAFDEVVSSILWIQRASIQILPAFLSLYASTYLPPLQEENRAFVFALGENLSALHDAYLFHRSGNDETSRVLSCVKTNLLKRVISLFSKDDVHSWFSSRKRANLQPASLFDDSHAAAMFDNPIFFHKNVPTKMFMQAQDALFPDPSSNKKSKKARRGSVVVTRTSDQSCWESCVRKLSNFSKLGISDASDCIFDGSFDVAFALAESGLPVQEPSEAQRLDQLETEAVRALLESQGQGRLNRARIWFISVWKSWKLFTFSLSNWIFEAAMKILLLSYRIVARVADLLGMKGALLLSSLESILGGHLDINFERRRFLQMDSGHKRILAQLNHLDIKDPNRSIAVEFSDASPPALVHSLIKSISVMEQATAVVSLGDAKREALMDQFFIQALDTLRLHLYTSPCLSKAEAKMRAQSYNFKVPIVNSKSSSSWIFRLNLVQNFLALGHSGAREEFLAAASNHSSSHMELLSALIRLSLSSSSNSKTRVAAVECLGCLLCGCSSEVLEAFQRHPTVQSPANSFYLSLAEAFESFRTSAKSRAMRVKKYSDLFTSFEFGLSEPAVQSAGDLSGEDAINPRFLALLKSEVQRCIFYEAPEIKFNNFFSFISESITYIYHFFLGPSVHGEEDIDIDVDEAPIFVRMLLKFIPIRRLRSLFQFLHSRLVPANDQASSSQSMQDIAVIATKRILSEGLYLFNACNALTRNLLVSPASFQANVYFQEILISQERHADLANNVDVSSRILSIIVQSLDAMQSGTIDMFDPFTIVNCYANLQKFCFGQNPKVVHALSESSFMTVYNRTITVMLSVFSFLNQRSSDETFVFLDGFHPIDIVLGLVLLLRNLCTSDSNNLTCPKVYDGISWNNLFKLSHKIAEYYKLNNSEKSKTFDFSLAALANVAAAIKEVFTNLLPNSESSLDLRRQAAMAQEVLACVFALKETISYHSSRESAVSAHLLKLFSLHELDQLPLFAGVSSRIRRIEVVRRDGKAELMFFQQPEELHGMDIGAGDLMPIRDSHGESLRSHLVEAERTRLHVIAEQAFGANFFRKFDYVPLVIGSLINLMLILFLALKVNDGEIFDDNSKHPAWLIPLQLNWDNFVDAMTWQTCETECKLEDNPIAKIVPNIFTQFRNGGGGDTFVGGQCAEFDPVLNATEYNECFKFPYSEQTQHDAAVAIGIAFLTLAFTNIVASGCNLLSWLYYSSQFVVRETILDRWYRDCKENSRPMFFTELESQFMTADSFKIILWNQTFWWLIFKCAVTVLSLVVHPIISCVLVIDAFRIKQVDYIFSAFTVKGKEFITLFLLISAIIYLNAVFGIVFYWDQMKNWSLQCSSLFQCTVSFFIVGWTGSIGDLMDAPEDDLGYPKYSDFRGSPGTPMNQGDGRLMFRLIWQLAFFIAVPTCLISVVTGIIIDSFTEIRQAINERREKLENSCFVCDISSDVWRKVALDVSARVERGASINFQSHVVCEHNILDYFSIFFRVRGASSLAHFTDQEHDLRRRFNQLDFTVFPTDQALSLARAAGASDESNESDENRRNFSFQDSRLAALELAINQLAERIKEQKVTLQPAPM